MCNNVDGTRGYYAKQNKSVRLRHALYDSTHMWNLRNKTDEHRGKKERQTIKQTLNSREKTESCWTGVGWGKWAKWVMGIKEGTFCDEH